jgi:hypothetical protein
MFKFKLAIITAAVLLTACQSTIESSLPVKEEFNREGKEIRLTVHAHKNEYELNKNVMNPAKGLNGQAVYAHTDNVCDIHAKKPKNVKLDDDYAKTLGHELMHCLYGDYHPHF